MEDAMETPKQDGQRIRLIEPLVNIVFTIAAIIWFNFFPDTVGYFVTANDPASFTPVLVPTFWHNLIWLDIWWGASLLLNIGHILSGRWTLVTRSVDILISIFGISVLIGLIAGACDIRRQKIDLLTTRLSHGLRVIYRL
jgi:hypothetical protein